MNFGEYYESKGAKAAQRRVPQHGEGVLADNFSFAPEVLIECQMQTKAGHACKARPVTNRDVCIGHLRQVEKLGS